MDNTLIDDAIATIWYNNVGDIGKTKPEIVREKSKKWSKLGDEKKKVYMNGPVQSEKKKEINTNSKMKKG